MPSDRSKETGRTVWDFLTSLGESRSKLLWASGIAWLAIAGFVGAATAGYVKISLSQQAPAAGSPWVHWWIGLVRMNNEECHAVALDALALVDGKKIRHHRSSGELTRIANVGNFTAWITCIESSPHALVYLGASGDDGDDVKGIIEKLEISFAPREVGR